MSDENETETKPEPEPETKTETKPKENPVSAALKRVYEVERDGQPAKDNKILKDGVEEFIEFIKKEIQDKPEPPAAVVENEVAAAGQPAAVTGDADADAAAKAKAEALSGGRRRSKRKGRKGSRKSRKGRKGGNKQQQSQSSQNGGRRSRRNRRKYSRRSKH
jgi:hypothetical protein